MSEILNNHILCLIIIFYLKIIHLAKCSDVEKFIYKSLFANYDSNVRPVSNSSQSVKIAFSVTINSILDVNERNQVFTTNLWVKWKWKDPRLRWNEQFFSRPAMRFSVDSLWTPDIILYNKADDFNTGGYKRVNSVVYANGTVIWLPPVVMRSSCPIDIFHFPFDIQVCPLKFGSWSYDITQLELFPLDKNVDNSTYMHNGEWVLVNTRLSGHIVRYNTDNKTYGDITLYFCIKRRSLYYWINVVAPCMCLNVLCLASFLMPPGAHGKVGLSISIMLSYFVYTNTISERLPRSSILPAIGIYLFASLLLAVLAVTFSVVAVHLKMSGSFSWSPNQLVTLSGSVLLNHIIDNRRESRVADNNAAVRLSVIDEDEELEYSGEDFADFLDSRKQSIMQLKDSLDNLIRQIEWKNSLVTEALRENLGHHSTGRNGQSIDRYQSIGVFINKLSFLASTLLLSSVTFYISYMQVTLDNKVLSICDKMVADQENKNLINLNSEILFQE